MAMAEAAAPMTPEIVALRRTSIGCGATVASLSGP
ncbi:MAG: hypothetical protein AVDCRST_MAG36-612 [uncultured Nocardioidaceae bacterium]|uniref:Uncharacterized protein n=1 Tax=uncultured Nocardioidaceae bacterium TaxID=253824 RepID=A0A6J4LC75_9ACTN|nr:MAG: hypothetical protein AVDCRST_MAG36-612 [uncultured Nocardioidaceae bacterium]